MELSLLPCPSFALSFYLPKKPGKAKKAEGSKGKDSDCILDYHFSVIGTWTSYKRMIDEAPISLLIESGNLLIIGLPLDPVEQESIELLRTLGGILFSSLVVLSVSEGECPHAGGKYNRTPSYSK